MPTSIKNHLNWRLMAPIFMIVAIDSMGMGVILPLLPFYAERFGASPIAIGLLFAVFSLCQFLSAPILGSWSDRTGRKPILMVSQLGTCVSLILLALSDNLPMLFFARILDGLTSGNLSVASAYAIDRCTTNAGASDSEGNRNSPSMRKQAIGTVSAGVGVGLIVGPALSAFSGQISAQAPVWIAAALSAISVFATMILLPAESREKGPSKSAKGHASKASLISSPVLAH